MTVGSDVGGGSCLYGLLSGSSGAGSDRQSEQDGTVRIGALCYGALSFQSMIGTKEKKEEGMVGMAMAHPGRKLGAGHAPEHDIERLYCDVNFPRLAQVARLMATRLMATRLMATGARTLMGQTA